MNGYLTVFFVILALYMLLIRRTRLFFGLAVGAAVLASLSFVHGFLVWPLGLICLLWSYEKNRAELAVWLLSAAAVSAVYFHGYDSSNPACSVGNCSLTYGLSHPGPFIGYLVMLVGNVIPLSTTGIESHLWLHGLQGTVLLLVAVLVVVQTLRERRVQPNPLPLLLIVFALLVDFVTAVGRGGAGLESAVSPVYGRYTMPNLILLVGLVIFAWDHMPRLTARFRLIGSGVLTALLLVQCIAGTVEGISNGRNSHATQEVNARILVNLDQVPQSEKPCYVDVAVFPGWYQFVMPKYRLAKQDQLSVFQPASERHYRTESLPVLAECAKRAP